MGLLLAPTGGRSRSGRGGSCWIPRWPACPRTRRRRCGRRARGGPGGGSRSMPPLTRGRMPSARRVAAMCIMTRAAAMAPARRSRAGSTSSSRRSATCAPLGRLSSTSSAPRRDPHPADDPAGPEPAAAPERPSRRLGAPLVILDAGYSAAALTAALAGQPVHLLTRLQSGSVLYADPVTWPGTKGRPGKHGMAVTCHNDPGQANPEPDESLDTPSDPALRDHPRRRLAPGSPSHPRRPRMVRRLGRRAARPARHGAARQSRTPARRPHPAQDHVAVARLARAAVPR